MKNKILKISLFAVLTAVAIGFGWMLFRFAVPMQDSVYELSAGAADGSDKAEDKGWTVFTNEDGIRTELSPNGIGGFSGLSYPGQTFYFSRKMDEQMESATLRLGAANRTVAVYLEDNLIYTDCPEQGGGIGSLNLPMLEYDRSEAVIITLPTDYQGKTLTIAQSTDQNGGEKQVADDTAWPCDVSLYCGYAYESELISESFQSAVPSSLLFTAGLALLLLFAVKLWKGKPELSLLCIAFTLFLYAVWVSNSAPYAGQYYTLGSFDAVSLCRVFALLSLLAFFALRAGKYRIVLWILTGLQGIRCILNLIPAIAPGLAQNSFFQILFSYQTELVGLLGILFAIVFGFIFWRRDSFFYKVFSLLSIGGIAVYMIVICFSPFFAPELWEKWCLQLRAAFENISFAYFRYLLMNLAVCTAATAAIAEFLNKEAKRRAEAQLLADRAELAQANYENLRAHDEEVMMLRHDMINHLRTLRGMNSSAQSEAYIDELIGKNEKIRPVVQSGNELLDILLNGKLAPAVSKGMEVGIIRAEAPEKLPLSDAELSSLILNILDNATKASFATDKPILKLDLHCKSGFFVICCENTFKPEATKKSKSPETLSGHGLGLKIINQIVESCGGLMTTETNNIWFRIIVAIPKAQDSK